MLLWFNSRKIHTVEVAHLKGVEGKGYVFQVTRLSLTIAHRFSTLLPFSIVFIVYFLKKVT